MKSIFILLVLGTVGFAMQPSPNGSRATSKTTEPAGSSFETNHYLQLGGALIGNSGINDRLMENGLGEYSPYALSLGFGSVRFYNRYANVSEFEALLWKKNEQNTMKSMLNVGRFTSLHGIRVIAQPSFSLYPVAGIGVGFTSLKLWPAEVSFDNALTTGSRSTMATSLFQATFIGDVGLGMQFSRPAPGKQTGRMSIGLRVGYVIDPITSKRWYRDRSVVTGGPDNNLSGPYVRITLGGAGEKKRCSDHEIGTCKAACSR